MIGRRAAAIVRRGVW